jgi:hypothetical protein
MRSQRRPGGATGSRWSPSLGKATPGRESRNNDTRKMRRTWSRGGYVGRLWGWNATSRAFRKTARAITRLARSRFSRIRAKSKDVSAAGASAARRHLLQREGK